MPRDLRLFFDRMSTSLLTLARDGRAVQLAKKLDEYDALLGCWLEVAPVGEAAPLPFSFAESAPRFAGPLEIDLYEVVRAGGASSDVETFIVITEAITRYLFKARHAEQLSLYGDFARMLGFALRLGFRTEPLKAAVGAAADRAMHSILSDFKSRHRNLGPSKGNESSEVFLAERPYLDIALALTLSLIGSAMEEGDVKHAEFLFERLVEHRRYERNQRNPKRRASTSEDVDTLHDYAILAMAGWSLHLLEQNYRDSTGAAVRVLRAALPQLGDKEELIALWELYHAGAVFGAAIDHRLGIERWDLRDRGEMRVGVSQVRSGGGEWRVRGLYAALLHNEQSRGWRVGQYFTSAPPRHMWNADSAEAPLKQLVTRNYLGIPEPKQDEAVSAVVSLIRTRQQTAEAARTHHAATASLDQARCEKLKRETVRSMQEHRHWPEAIRKLGGTARAATFATPVTLELGQYVPRESVIADGGAFSGFGKWVGEQGALWESVLLIGVAERAAEEGPAVTALAQLAESVRDARRTLVSRGFQPNLLIIPGMDRFAAALFQKPLWEVEERQDFGSLGYGAWEGLHVLRFPYTDPRSIIVADAGSFFGTVAHEPSQIRVDIRELTPDEVADLADKRPAEGGVQRSQRSDAQVLVTVRARPLLGVSARDGDSAPMAAIALDIRDSDGGYAMLAGDNKYHRPSCPQIEFEDPIQYSLSRHLPGESKDRQPCEVCHPERWNAEGRRGPA